MKIGIVFAGQGAQYPGMGQDLYEYSPAAKTIFDQAGEEIKHWCFSGTKEELRQTHITQPTIYTVTMAAYEAFREAMEKDGSLADRVQVTGYAGFSLGEYAALTATGAIRDVGQGQAIVTKRGKWMFEAGADEAGNQRGGMVAGMGDRTAICDLVEKVRGGDILEAANFNSPVQTVVAGEKPAVERFADSAKEAGIKAVMLSVSTAFHTPLMDPAAEKLEGLLLEEGLSQPTGKIYSNLTGRDIMENFDGSDPGVYLAGVMGRQARKPVYWQETIENMIADGVDAILEIGPGKTLSGFVRKIQKGMPTLHVEDGKSLAETMDALREMK